MNIGSIFAVFISTGFGIGYIRKAPGTFGTLLAAGLFWLLLPTLKLANSFEYLAWIVGVLFLCFIGVWITSKAEKVMRHDDPRIVLDEICGYFVSMSFLPLDIDRPWILLLYAFVLFRVFDIAKPFPINKIQVLPRGWGIMADDVLAGVFTNLLLQGLIRIYPHFFGL